MICPVLLTESSDRQSNSDWLCAIKMPLRNSYQSENYRVAINERDRRVLSSCSLYRDVNDRTQDSRTSLLAQVDFFDWTLRLEIAASRIRKLK